MLKNKTNEELAFASLVIMVGITLSVFWAIYFRLHGNNLETFIRICNDPNGNPCWIALTIISSVYSFFLLGETLFFWLCKMRDNCSDKKETK